MISGSTTVSIEKPDVPVNIVSAPDFTPYARLSFDEIESRSLQFAKKIVDTFDALADVLLEYESFEVVEDEVARTLDILRSLHENKKYFQLRINEIAAFLPRNQPLYAFTCFVVIPSFMAHKVYFRIPYSMRSFF